MIQWLAQKVVSERFLLNDAILKDFGLAKKSILKDSFWKFLFWEIPISVKMFSEKHLLNDSILKDSGPAKKWSRSSRRPRSASRWSLTWSRSSRRLRSAPWGPLTWLQSSRKPAKVGTMKVKRIMEAKVGVMNALGVAKVVQEAQGLLHGGQGRLHRCRVWLEYIYMPVYSPIKCTWGHWLCYWTLLYKCIVLMLSPCLDH
jgi:hypothetical protein